MTSTSTPEGPKSQPPIRLSLGKKIGFALLVTASFFALVETGLWLIGVDSRPTSRDQFVGYAGNSPLFIAETLPDGTRQMATALPKLVWFNPQSFLMPKPTGTKRVFCVGGSTTFGRPFADSTSYAGWLREFLNVVDPSVNWEVINAGGVSYASYRVARVMEELADYEPDLFIVLSAHNEFLERRTYPKDYFEPPTIGTKLHNQLGRSRVWTLLERATHPERYAPATSASIVLPDEVDERLNHTVGPSTYQRDEAWTDDVVSHYQLNLNRMIEIARSVGAEIVMIDPATNEKDCSPFKSDHALGDLRDADVQFEAGSRLFSTGDRDAAAEHFLSAIANDICPLRATEAIHNALRTVAESQNVTLIEFQRRLRDQSRFELGHECLGSEYFLDHVHPTIDVHRDLAGWIIEDLLAAGIVDGSPVDPATVKQIDSRVKSQLNRFDQGVSLRNLAKVMHWAGKFRDAVRSGTDALDYINDDPESLFVVADSLYHLGRSEESYGHYQRLFRSTPQYSRAFGSFGELLHERSEYQTAQSYLMRAVVADPDNPRPYYYLGQSHRSIGEFDFATEAFAQSDSLLPNQPGVLFSYAETEVLLGNDAHALELFEQVCKLTPADPEPFIRRGLIYLKQTRHQSAVEMFASAMLCDSADLRAETLYKLASKQLAQSQQSGDTP